MIDEKRAVALLKQQGEMTRLRLGYRSEFEEALEHALQAIEDRAALVEVAMVPKSRMNVLTDARRHMEGE